MRLKYSFSIICLISATLSSSVQSSKISREEYIERYSPLAVSLMKETGIPASITIAQGLLESASGNSTLAMEARNHFGIKCHSWRGDGYMKYENGRKECYRSYRKAEDSYRDHADFLRYRDRYAFLFELDAKDYKGWAYGLRKAGYAEDPDYPKKLIKLIEDNDLSRFDEGNISLPPTPGFVQRPVKVKPKKNSQLYKISLDRELLSTNGVTYIKAFGWETYSSLAEEYDLFTQELLHFNDLKSDRRIERGTVVYLERKKSKGAKYLEKHVVEEGETLYALSQRYAVRLKSLYKMNNIVPGDEAIPGTIIKLRK